jgi:hypothetical protein
MPLSEADTLSRQRASVARGMPTRVMRYANLQPGASSSNTRSRSAPYRHSSSPAQVRFAAPAGSAERSTPSGPCDAGDCIRGTAQARSAAPPKVGRRECNRAASAGPRRSA